MTGPAFTTFTGTKATHTILTGTGGDYCSGVRNGAIDPRRPTLIL
jgi:hypothetical protein